MTRADWEWQRLTRWSTAPNVRRSVSRLSGRQRRRKHADVERGRRRLGDLYRDVATLSPIRFPQGRRARPGAELADFI